MGANGTKRTGGELMVDTLSANGATLAFGVPGESFLAVLDGFYGSNQMEFVISRQEGGAAMMADAYGKLTGRPGICFVTRGPGATNASPGVHIAYQDSSPMILFIGQVGRSMLDREAFQEIDYRRMFGQMSKWTAEISDAARIPEYVNRAFHVATSGRPGPVVLALPEDMLRDRVAKPEMVPARRVPIAPGTDALGRLRQLLAAAERPLLMLGGRGWDQAACEAIRSFAEANHLPVTCAFRYQDLFDNDHPLYAGDVGLGLNPKLAERIGEADLVLAVGPRLGEITTSGYTLFEPPWPQQKLVHVHAGVEELGRVYEPELAINASMTGFAKALGEIEPVHATWHAWTNGARADFEAWSTPTLSAGDVQLSQIVTWLRDNTPDDTIICNGAGNYATWVHRFYRYRRHGTQLAPTSGSMGYGTPAAVAAKLVHPDRTVIAFAGDGCFMMNGQEIATAVQYDANIVVVVVANNRMLGTIRMHQERAYPGRVVGTDLINPDFAALAQAYGAHGERVSRTEDFAGAFERALNAGRPALIELEIDPEALTPGAGLSAIREAAQNS